MRKQNLYTVQWVSYGEEYDRLEDLTWKEVLHYKLEARLRKLEIIITKQM